MGAISRMSKGMLSMSLLKIQHSCCLAAVGTPAWLAVPYVQGAYCVQDGARCMSIVKAAAGISCIVLLCFVVCV